MPIIVTPSVAGEIFEIDPTSEDAANVPLVLVDNVTYFLLAEDFPPPALDQAFASSVSTEGEIPVSARYKNRTGTLTLRVAAGTAAALQTAVNYIDKKAAKIVREGGTLKCTTPTGDVFVLDLVAGEQAVSVDRGFITNNRTQVTITFLARPFWRQAPVTLSSHAETTLPCNIFTEALIKGDVPGLGRLIVTEAQAADQWWLTYGIQSRYYSSSADAALYYEAEGRTPQGGGAATAVGPTGASGGGSNTILANNLATVYQSILSTQASGGGNHLSHIGTYQAYARVQVPAANSGTVSIALQWAVGDFGKVTTNTAVSLASTGGTWRLVNLGQASIPKVAQGTQRWEGRILARSTAAGDDIYIDHLTLIPVTEGAGIVSAKASTASPTTFSARDEFDQTAGALAGKVAPTGGTWADVGSTTGFNVIAGSAHYLSRAVAADRYATLGVTSYAAIGAQVDVSASDPPGVNGLFTGPLVRFVDTGNHAMAVLQWPTSSTGTAIVYLMKRIAGASILSPTVTVAVAFNTTYTIRVVADAAGRFFIWLFAQGSAPGSPVLAGQDPDLATGGVLASGEIGIFDWNAGTTSTRIYDNFAAWAPTTDAAVFASRQVEVRNDRVIRQDSAGAVWATPSKFEGDYLLIPPSGREARTSRVIVKATRHDPTSMPDPSIDDITAQLVYTPRFLTRPE